MAGGHGCLGNIDPQAPPGTGDEPNFIGGHDCFPPVFLSKSD
jgi:hypothetical protein